MQEQVAKGLAEPAHAPTRSDWKGLVALMLVLGLCSGVSLFLPQFIPLPEGELPFSLPVMALISSLSTILIYGAAGSVGLILSSRQGFPSIWAGEQPLRSRIVLPALAGALIGLLMIPADLAFSGVNGLGALPHPPFPTSLVASLSAGIGEEAIFRLFLIPLIMWPLLKLTPLHPVVAFWLAASLAALLFGLGHLPSLYAITGMTPDQLPNLWLLAEILLLNGVVGMAAAYAFLRSGYLAAVVLHFSLDVVWHVLWGAVGG